MSIISNAKEIAELVKAMGNIELYRKIVELEGEIIELTREKRTLEEQNEELNRALTISKELKFNTPAYFTDGDKTPYCPKCWESDKRAVHMIRGVGNNNRTEFHFHCPQCQTAFWLGIRRHNLD